MIGAMEDAMRKLVAACATVTLCGCGMMGTGASDGPKAVANLEPTKGNATAGKVTFTQRGDKVAVNASITGLKPNSEHAFHVHDKGDCSSGDGMSTGGHFNPAGKPHGPQSSDHHAGDMPSLKSDAGGNASASFELSGVTVGGGGADLVGRGLIVHRDPDDFKTQPTGNAGPRVACAVIKAA
jgi:Cu-Zn family superoxide dismutase